MFCFIFEDANILKKYGVAVPLSKINAKMK